MMGAVLSQYTRDIESKKRQEALAHLSLEGRRELLKNFFSFTAGFTLLYALSGATIGLIGEGVKEPLGDHQWILSLIGGAFIIFFSLRLLGFFSLMKFDVWTSKMLFSLRQRLFPRRLGKFEATSQPRIVVRPLESFLTGIGLSSGCLSCMGGAVLYPLLVFAGISSWYWGFLTLGVYSLLVALPMMFLALGGAHWIGSLAFRRRSALLLQRTSGVLLLMTGLLVIEGRGRLVADFIFRGIAKITQAFGIL